MKRIAISMYACAVLMLALLSSCNTTGTAAAGSSDKVSLAVNLAPGTVYKQVSKTEQTSEQSVMGMKTKTASTTEIYLKNEVLTVSPEGEAEIKCTYERVKMEMDNGIAGKSSFDSDKAEGDVPMQSQAYSAMIGKSIVFKLNKQGTVTSVAGVDSLLDGVMRAVGGEGPELEMMKTTMKSVFGDDAMKSMMQSASIQYPESQVGEGDTWGKQISSMGAMPIKMDVTYKVDHVDGDKVVLSFDGNITTDKDKALDLGMVQMEMDLKGTYSGTSEISRKTGMVTTSTVTQDMDGSMKTMGMSVPMKIHQVISVNPY